MKRTLMTTRDAHDATARATGKASPRISDVRPTCITSAARPPHAHALASGTWTPGRSVRTRVEPTLMLDTTHPEAILFVPGATADPRSSRPSPHWHTSPG